METSYSGESLVYHQVVLGTRLFLRNNRSALVDAVKLEFTIRDMKSNPRVEDFSRFYGCEASRLQLKCQHCVTQNALFHSLHWKKSAESSVV